MKKRAVYMLLAALAIICLLVNITRMKFTGYFSSAMAFPFEQLGMALRTLSLSGGLGNTLALLVYWAISLLPVAALAVISKRRSLVAEDNLLALLTVVLLVVLYRMVNPGTISAGIGTDAQLTFVKAILGIAVYSVLAGYFIIRLVRMFSAGNTRRLASYMSAMLVAMATLFICTAFGSCFGQTLNSFAALREGNTGNEHLLGPSYVFLAVQFIIAALPYVLDALVALAATELLRQLETHRYSPEAVAAAANVSRLCVKALILTAISTALFNVLQLLFAHSLLVVNMSLSIPVVSIAYVLAALLLTRLVAENKRLMDDNDMFI